MKGRDPIPAGLEPSWSRARPRRPGSWSRRVLVVGWLLGAQAVAVEPTTLDGRALGTTWSAKWVLPAGAPAPAGSGTRARLAARLEEIEKTMSTYRPESELSRFNRHPGCDWVNVSRDLAGLVAQAREISAHTGGAFDATVGSLTELWGFGPAPARAAWPDDRQIAAARARVGWQRLEVRLDPPALRKRDPALCVDLSSIAKGFAVDEMSRLLSQLGLANHLVQIGGDLRAAGPGPAGAGWRVGIEEPVEAPAALARVVALRDCALSTSGNYRNQRSIAGRTVGHIIDPRSGLPVSSPLAAVSVRHPSCAVSSALATGLLVLGPEAGPGLAARERVAAVFLLRAGTSFRQETSPAFASAAP